MILKIIRDSAINMLLHYIVMAELVTNTERRGNLYVWNYWLYRK